MPEFSAKLKGPIRKGRWMSEAAKRNTVVLLSTVGLGAVIALWVVPWQMNRLAESQNHTEQQAATSQEFAQTKLVDMLEKSVGATERSTAATQAQTLIMSDQTSKLDDLVESHEDLCIKLDDLIELQTKAAK